jgi:glycosyltransferase involved in cell wall biosynthesis
MADVKQKGIQQATTDESPLVSIIVPVFNVEKYLENCINSLLEQSYQNIEIICIDDGSTDSSTGMLEKYAAEDKRIIVLRQENQGPGPARNLALKTMHGKYVLFVDADDSLEVNAVSECIAIIEDTPCDMVLFNTNIIEDARSVSGLKNSSGEYITLVNMQNEGRKNKTETIKMMFIATVWGKMFRTDLIKRYHLVFSRHMIGEDARFLLSYLLIIKSAYALNKTFYNYYLRPKEAFHAKHPWIGRLFRFPGIFIDVFKFTLKNGMPFRIYYFFLWLIEFFKSRKKR